jgi:hypothetical protein
MALNRGILGHVEWKDGIPAEEIKISITEKDLIFDDILPTTTTDKDGNFIITYNPDQYTIKGPLQEKPDIELMFEYKHLDVLKKVKVFYKNVELEWLTIDKLILDDISDECEPILEEIEPFKGENIFPINLKETIDVDNPENNDIWEVYVGTILEFSEKSIVPEHTTLKINSWGGKAIVANVINEGSISKEEKKLNEKSIELLEARTAKFDEITLLFNWLDEDGNIIHDSIHNKSDTNYILIDDISIFIPKPTSRTEETEFLPTDRLEINCRVIIKGIIKEFKILSMDSLQNLIL